MSRNRVLRPRGGQKPEKHPEIVVFNPTPGPPISTGSELHLWSELLPLIMKLCSLRPRTGFRRRARERGAPEKRHG